MIDDESDPKACTRDHVTSIFRSKESRIVDCKSAEESKHVADLEWIPQKNLTK